MEIKRLNYPVLNNPREALLLPLADLYSATVMSRMAQEGKRPQNTVKAQGDTFTYSLRDGEPSFPLPGIVVKREGESALWLGAPKLDESSPCGRKIVGHYEGLLGPILDAQRIDLDVDADPLNGTTLKGSLGSVKLRETLSNSSLNADKVADFSIEGRVGGLDYQEEFYLSKDEIHMNSRGRLGREKVERKAELLPDGSVKVKGRIGEMEFEEFIVGQPRK